MNAALGDILTRLIGSFVGDQAPKVNPYFGQQPGDVDPSLKVDPSQLVQQPYVTPSWGTRFFHPDVASQETSKNLEAFNALISNAARKAVDIKNTGDVIPVLGKPLAEAFRINPSGATSMYPNLSAEGVASSLGASADVANNLPAMGSLERLGTAADVIRRQAARLATDSPEKEVTAGNVQSDYTTRLLPSDLDYRLGRNAMETALMPSELFARGYGNLATGEASRRPVANSEAMDRLFSQGLRTEANKGTVAEALSGEAAQPDAVKDTMMMQTLARSLGLFQAMHPEYPNTLINLNMATGKPMFNRDYVNMLQTINAKIKGTGGEGAGIKPVGRLSNGLNVLDIDTGTNEKSTPTNTGTGLIGNLRANTHTVTGAGGKEIELPNDPAYVAAKRGQLVSKAQDNFRKGIPLTPAEIKFFTPAELKTIYGTR